MHRPNLIIFDYLEDPKKNCFSRKLITLKHNIASVVLKVMPSYMYWTTE